MPPEVCISDLYLAPKKAKLTLANTSPGAAGRMRHQEDGHQAAAQPAPRASAEEAAHAHAPEIVSSTAQVADAAGGRDMVARGGALPLSDTDLHLKDHIKLRDASAGAADRSADAAASDTASSAAAEAAAGTSTATAGTGGGKAWPRRPTGRPWDAAKTAILITVMDPDDTQALKATLESLEKVPKIREHEVFVSQDVPNSRLNSLIVKYQAKGAVVHVMLNLPKEDKALLREARHVRAGVNHVFGLKGKNGQDFERIIVFDHDLEFSPSVLGFYETCNAVLDKDPSLFAASAWNELGLPQV